MSDHRGPPRELSLTKGGPFYRLMGRCHLLAADGSIRGWWLGLFAWLPLACGELLRILFGRPVDPTFLDLSVHLRLLVALPMILVAERVIEDRCRSAMISFYDGKFCDRTALDSIVGRGEHLRDLRAAEAVLLALALLGGQLTLWQITGSTGVFHGVEDAGAWSFPRIWYAALALPLGQFVLYRWLWRWVIWSYMLARIARLPLSAIATHPDHAAGLGCLARPTVAFAAFAFGIGAVLAGAWGTSLIAHRTTVQALLPGLVAYLLAVAAIAVAPLFVFCGHLYRIRKRSLAQYDDFATAYTWAFHRRWIVGRQQGEAALGSPDIQSLADLGNSYKVVEDTRYLAFGMRPLLTIWIAALIPMVPLFASVLTVEEVLKRILGTVLGGAPD